METFVGIDWNEISWIPKRNTKIRLYLMTQSLLEKSNTTEWIIWVDTFTWKERVWLKTTATNNVFIFTTTQSAFHRVQQLTDMAIGAVFKFKLWKSRSSETRIPAIKFVILSLKSSSIHYNIGLDDKLK